VGSEIDISTLPPAGGGWGVHHDSVRIVRRL
jgi:hypothetical protein